MKKPKQDDLTNGAFAEMKKQLPGLDETSFTWGYVKGVNYMLKKRRSITITIKARDLEDALRLAKAQKKNK